MSYRNMTMSELLRKQKEAYEAVKHTFGNYRRDKISQLQKIEKEIYRRQKA